VNATKRIRNIAIGVAVAGVTTVALAVTLPASAATPTNNDYGQVMLKLDTVPRSLGSVRADGNQCQALDWKNIANWDYIGLPGNDGKILRTTKGAQLTFRGYSSTDCSGQSTSIIIRTFGDPDLMWATGSRYEIPWNSN
jgi:hypothetical protein